MHQRLPSLNRTTHRLTSLPSQALAQKMTFAFRRTPCLMDLKSSANLSAPQWNALIKQAEQYIDEVTKAALLDNTITSKELAPVNLDDLCCIEMRVSFFGSGKGGRWTVGIHDTQVDNFLTALLQELATQMMESDCRDKSGGRMRVRKHEYKGYPAGVLGKTVVYVNGVAVSEEY